MIYQLTEPVLAPMRRGVQPVQMGGVMFDISVVFSASQSDPLGPGA